MMLASVLEKKLPDLSLPVVTLLSSPLIATKTVTLSSLQKCTIFVIPGVSEDMPDSLGCLEVVKKVGELCTKDKDRQVFVLCGESSAAIVRRHLSCEDMGRGAAIICDDTQAFAQWCQETHQINGVLTRVGAAQTPIYARFAVHIVNGIVTTLWPHNPALSPPNAVEAILTGVPQPSMTPAIPMVPAIPGWRPDQTDIADAANAAPTIPRSTF
jgi:hypothetical protein